MIQFVIPIAGFEFKSNAFPEAKEDNGNSYPVPISFFNPTMNHSNKSMLLSMASLFTLRP